MPQAACLACPCRFCFLFFRARFDEIFYISLAFSHLCFISRVRYVFFNIFCVKRVAIRNKPVLKIVGKRASSNAAKQEAFAFRERAPAADASFLAKCCAFYACQRFLSHSPRIAAASKNNINRGKPCIF